MFLLAATSLYAHYDAARALDDFESRSGWRWQLMELLHTLLAPMDGAADLLAATGGTTWSLRIGWLDLTDPLAAAEVLFTAQTLPLTLAASVAAPVLGTLLLGKVFCSWFCPAYLLFELSGKLRRLLRIAEIQPGSLRFSANNKYALLAAGLLIGAGLGLPFFSLVYPPAVLGRTLHALVFGFSMSGGLVLLGGLLLFELLVSPRWWCRSMCPGGALYGMIGWARPLRVGLDAQRCDGCGGCRPVCELGLNPVRESAGLECDNCGRCVGVCPQAALSWGVGLPGRGRAA